MLDPSDQNLIMKPIPHLISTPLTVSATPKTLGHFAETKSTRNPTETQSDFDETTKNHLKRDSEIDGTGPGKISTEISFQPKINTSPSQKDNLLSLCGAQLSTLKNAKIIQVSPFKKRKMSPKEAENQEKPNEEENSKEIRLHSLFEENSQSQEKYKELNDLSLSIQKLSYEPSSGSLSFEEETKSKGENYNGKSDQRKEEKDQETKETSCLKNSEGNSKIQPDFFLKGMEEFDKEEEEEESKSLNKSLSKKSLYS